MVAIVILIAGIIAPDEGMTFAEVLNISSEYFLDACQWGCAAGYSTPCTRASERMTATGPAPTSPNGRWAVRIRPHQMDVI